MPGEHAVSQRLIAPKEAASEWLLGTAGTRAPARICACVHARRRTPTVARASGSRAYRAASGLTCSPPRAPSEMDVGSWSGLDESGPDKLGVGLFFQHNPADGCVFPFSHRSACARPRVLVRAYMHLLHVYARMRVITLRSIHARTCE